jgi:hypothetical protein
VELRKGFFFRESVGFLMSCGSDTTPYWEKRRKKKKMIEKRKMIEKKKMMRRRVERKDRRAN